MVYSFQDLAFTPILHPHTLYDMSSLSTAKRPVIYAFWQRGWVQVKTHSCHEQINWVIVKMIFFSPPHHRMSHESSRCAPWTRLDAVWPEPQPRRPLVWCTGASRSGGSACVIGWHELSSPVLRRSRWARDSGVAGVKWRCLKEQRKKFAITMTVNIRLGCLGLSLCGVSLEERGLSGNVTRILLSILWATELASRRSVLTPTARLTYMVLARW